MAIDASVNNETFDYQPGEQARLFFEARTGLSWTDTSEPLAPVIKCPKCSEELNISLTRCHYNMNWLVDQTVSTGTGLADKDFGTRCLKCYLRIDHELLRAQKFRKDIMALNEEDIPMAGTGLSAEGI